MEKKRFHIFINPTGQSAKLLGKTRRRRKMRRIAFWAGIGCAVTAITLYLAGVFQSAPQPLNATGDNGQAAISSIVAQNRIVAWKGSQPVFQGNPDAASESSFLAAEGGMLIPTPTPMVALSPGATEEPDAVLELGSEPTPTPTPVPTPELTPTPTPTPTPEPTPPPVDWDKLVDFYMVEADTYYNDMGYSSNYYEYTENDVYLLAQLIYGEARGESTKGKIAVGNVVMNRVLSRGYPGDTVEKVIKAPGQFTGYSSSIRPNSSCKSIARRVLQDQEWVIPQDVYFFNSERPEGEDWGGHSFYKKIDGHCFYRESYSGRNRNGEIPPKLFDRTFKWPQYGCKPEKRVSRVQFMLNQLGYDVKADGYFGMTSKEALIKFQNDKKLEADGVAGPGTIKALIKAYGIEKYLKKYN